MHDPLVLLWTIRRPPISPREWHRTTSKRGLRRWNRLPGLIDVWHQEPNDQDAGKVCGWGRARYWHVHHYHLRFWPVFNLRRWLFQPCASCGRRFRYRDARFSYMGTDKTWHEECMSLGDQRKLAKVMLEVLHRLCEFYGITTEEQLREIVVNPDERRDQFLLHYRTWEQLTRYREQPPDERWRAPNQHITERLAERGRP